MLPFIEVQGVAIPMPMDDVNTDQIIPSKYLKFGKSLTKLRITFNFSLALSYFEASTSDYDKEKLQEIKPKR